MADAVEIVAVPALNDNYIWMLRDLGSGEVAGAALKAAETGHMVVSTLHTIDAGYIESDQGSTASGATHLVVLPLGTVVREAGGRVYPAKDARMSNASFRAYYPEWEAFRTFVDPRFSSSFWRRVTAGSAA